MKILVVAPAWVGDMVMAQSLIQVLNERPQTPEIHVLAPAATAPLAERMPGVARTHVLPLGHGELGLGVRYRVAKGLRAERFDQAIVLPNTFKSALVPWLSRIPRRTGWRGEFRYGVLNDGRRLVAAEYPRLVERYVALGVALGARPGTPIPLPRLIADREKGTMLCAEREIPTTFPVLALCPGAEYGPAKRWPVRHFVAVGEHHLRSGGSVWLFGSARDAESTGAVHGALVEKGYHRQVFDLAGHTSLAEAIDLIALSDTVVTNDSGLMHVACALEKRVIAVYGSTSPEFTPPLGHSSTVVRDPPPCSPCFERVCPLGHTRCLEDLAPRLVIAAMQSGGGR